MDQAKEVPQSSALGSTDANMIVYNDYPQSITFTVDNNNDMSSTFPNASPIPSGGNVSGYVQASSWPGQSSFDVHHQSGETMTIDIGSGDYSTGASPEYLKSGQGGVLLAPGPPLTDGVDYTFFFFNGPGVIPPLINSAIQANLPAIIDYISQNSINIPLGSDASLVINSLKLDPTAVQCTYAAMIPDPNGNGNLWNTNIVLNVAQGTAAGSATIEGQAGDFGLSITDCYLYVQLQLDLTFKTKPQVKALQISFGDFSLSGAIIEVLEALIPVFGELLSPYHIAGAINTIFNTFILDAINSAISSAFAASKSSGDSTSDLIKEFRSSASLPISPRVDKAKIDGRPADTDLSLWMSNPAIQAQALGQLKLSGTHDSGTYALTPVLSTISYPDIQLLWYLNNGTAPVNGQWPVTIPPTAANPLYIGPQLYSFIMGQAVNSISRTQDTTILQQLQSGIRHFDLRVFYNSDDQTLYVQHALIGPSLIDILGQFQTFIKNISQSENGAAELIFVYISHTNLADYPDQISNLTSLINKFISSQNVYYPSSSPGKSTFDFQSLANDSVSSITQGAPKIMFMNGDFADEQPVAFSDTVVNTAGYAGAPWDGELYTVKDLISREGPALQNHEQPLWSVGWVLGADTPTIIQTILTLLTGVQKWALQDVATNANSSLQEFLAQYAGPKSNFNLVVVDWFEFGASPTVPEMIIAMNA